MAISFERDGKVVPMSLDRRERTNASADLEEGTRAFAEKPKPEFRNR